MTIEKLITNAINTGKQAHHVALAAALVLPGQKVQALCCWCAEAKRSEYPNARTLPRGGECYGCSYAGVDCLVVWADQRER